MQYQDRQQAGRLLGQALLDFARQDVAVVGLPRGGVPVAFEVARILEAPLEIWIARKLGVPRRPELGMGAVAEGPALYVDRGVLEKYGLSGRQVVAVAEREGDELRRRAARLRGGHPPPYVRGRAVILVDDGVATGGTIRAAIEGLRKHGADKVILAVPVASPGALAAFRPLVDGLVCLFRPKNMQAIGTWYEDFRQVSDFEVVRLLDIARRPVPGSGRSSSSTAVARHAQS